MAVDLDRRLALCPSLIRLALLPTRLCSCRPDRAVSFRCRRYGAFRRAQKERSCRCECVALAHAIHLMLPENPALAMPNSTINRAIRAATQAGYNHHFHEHKTFEQAQVDLQRPATYTASEAAFEQWAAGQGGQSLVWNAADARRRLSSASAGYGRSLDATAQDDRRPSFRRCQRLQSDRCAPSNDCGSGGASGEPARPYRSAVAASR